MKLKYLFQIFRYLGETMVMTGSDLCASTKPWALQVAGYFLTKNTNTKPRALQVALL